MIFAHTNVLQPRHSISIFFSISNRKSVKILTTVGGPAEIRGGSGLSIAYTLCMCRYTDMMSLNAQFSYFASVINIDTIIIYRHAGLSLVQNLSPDLLVFIVGAPMLWQTEKPMK